MQQTYAAALSPPVSVQSAKPGMPEHSLKNHAVFQRQEYSNVLLLEMLVSAGTLFKDAWGRDEAVLGAHLTAAARC